MVNLKEQYLKIHTAIDAAIRDVINTSAFINGKQVGQFAEHLAAYCGVKYVVPCASGTDALQLSLMALDLRPGDEIIVPAFTYAATAEAAALLGIVPVLVDVDKMSFNMSATSLLQALSPRTKAVVPVHLFGQSCDMEPILAFAQRHGLYVIEDNAQSLGADYTFSDGRTKKTGTMGNIGCTSFFPSKNLGCYGDGGALMTDDEEIAEKLRILSNHGQRIKYRHDFVGCNSRLDTIQAAVLDVKLRFLDEYNYARRQAAFRYTKELRDFPGLIVPRVMPYSAHVFHQYTLQVTDGNRDALKAHLAAAGIPSMIYYPTPLHEQPAYKDRVVIGGPLSNAERLSEEVLSLPMHTELTASQQNFIVEALKGFL